MPVDFSRVPSRVKVPKVSRPSVPVWVFLLCLMLAAGVSLTIFMWPAGKPTNTGCFWFCAVGLPVLIWGLLLSCRFAWLYGRVSAALATNQVSDRIERQCHELSSKPLVIFAHAWRFSSSQEENSVEALVDEKTNLRPVPSQARPSTDVIARWITIPGRQFYAGNALTEHARQTELCEWLLKQLANDIAPQLRRLPQRVWVKVDLCVDSILEPASVVALLQSVLNEQFPTLRTEINPPTRKLSLFHVDSWHDGARIDEIRLLVAVQLRNATSEVLAGGIAEAATMMLVGSPVVATELNEKSPLCIHRPAQGASEKVTDVLGRAARWGSTSLDDIETTWLTGLDKVAAKNIRSSCHFKGRMKPVDLDATVGNAGAARAWLAATLAAANAALVNEPQLVIAQEGDDLVALVCQKQT